MGDRAKLLRHREAILFQAAFRSGNCQMQSAAKVGSSQWNGEGEPEARLIQLVD